MTSALEIQLIAIIVAVACSLSGNFLVLRKMSMMADSITHTILLGIVLAFFTVEDLSSPLLIIGAGAMGVITVWLTEIITKTKIVSSDSAIGIVFPALFSIAIILISKFASSVHLDTDAVLLGELAFAPFDRMIIFGIDIGAKAIYTSLGILLINAVFVLLLYKELKLVTFDSLLAATIGFSPTIIHYALMSVVSITAVGAFESVGSVLVVAFMIVPCNTAYLLTDDLKKMIGLSFIFAVLSGVLGYQLACVFDVSIAGSMAVMVGIIFTIVFIFAPERGLISSFLRKSRQRKEFAQITLLFYIRNHYNKQGQKLSDINSHLKWEGAKLENTVKNLHSSKKIDVQGEYIFLTITGREFIDLAIQNLFEVKS